MCVVQYTPISVVIIVATEFVHEYVASCCCCTTTLFSVFRFAFLASYVHVTKCVRGSFLDLLLIFLMILPKKKVLGFGRAHSLNFLAFICSVRQPR